MRRRRPGIIALLRRPPIVYVPLNGRGPIVCFQVRESAFARAEPPHPHDRFRRSAFQPLVRLVSPSAVCSARAGLRKRIVRVCGVVFSAVPLQWDGSRLDLPSADNGDGWQRAFIREVSDFDAEGDERLDGGLVGFLLASGWCVG